MIMRTMRKHCGCSSVNQTLHNMLEALCLIPRNTYIHVCTHAHTTYLLLEVCFLKFQASSQELLISSLRVPHPYTPLQLSRIRVTVILKCPLLLETSFKRQSLNFLSLTLSWAYSSHNEENLS